jgi:hypothetical protein
MCLYYNCNKSVAVITIINHDHTSYAAADDVWSAAARMITVRYGYGMAVYKGLFVANCDQHNYNGCAQVAYMSIAALVTEHKP